MNGMRTGLQHRIDRAVHQMESQHRHLRELGDQIDRAVAAGHDAEIERWLQRFRDALRSHFELEETVLFPAVHGLAPEALGRLHGLEADHKNLIAAIDPLIQAPAVPGAETRIDVLGRVRSRLHAHERREEALVHGALASARQVSPSPRRSR